MDIHSGIKPLGGMDTKFNSNPSKNSTLCNLIEIMKNNGFSILVILIICFQMIISIVSINKFLKDKNSNKNKPKIKN